MRALARDGLVKFEKDKDNNIVKIGKRNNPLRKKQTTIEATLKKQAEQNEEKKNMEERRKSSVGLFAFGEPTFPSRSLAL